MSAALAPLLAGGIAALALQPEAASSVLALAAAMLGCWLHVALPPPEDAAVEAVMLAAVTGM